MSHVTTIKAEILDLDALKEACSEIGMEFRENQRKYRWFGRHVGDYPLPEGFSKSDLGRCDHAIGVPRNRNAYEIGVVERDNSFKLLFDFWNKGFGLEAAAGKGCEKLIESYTRIVARKTAKNYARANGWTLSEQYN